MSGQAVFQGGEDAAAVVVGDDDPKIGRRLARPDDQAGGVVHRSDVTQQCVGRPFGGERDADCR